MSLTEAVSWFTSAVMIIIALPLGLIFARIITDRHSIIYDLLYLSEYFTCSFFQLHKKAGCDGVLLKDNHIGADDYYNKDTELKGIAEIIIAKQRNGPIGTVKMAWIPEQTRFADLAKNMGS